MNDSGFTPTGDLILVLPPKVEEKTVGGIVLPQMTIDKEQTAGRIGVIIAMGDEAPLDPRMKDIGVGDKVLFPRYVQDRWVVGGDVYFIMRASSVQGKVTKIPDYEINAARPNSETFGINKTVAAA